MPANSNNITHNTLLRELCLYINKEAAGFYMQEIFSLNKNELIVKLRQKDAVFILEAYMDENTSFLFFPDRAESGRNTKSLFEELDNAKFTGANANENDRSLCMNFEGGYSILFKMYGRNANVVLFHDEKVTDVFREQFPKDYDLKLADFKPLASGTAESRYYIYGQESSYPVLSLEEQKEELIAEVNSAAEAVSIYSSEYLRRKFFHSKKQSLYRNLIKQKEHIENSITSAKTSLAQLENDKSYKNQADILMANLHAILLGTEKAELYDFYNDKPIIIKLKRTLTPQKQAEALYRKSRNQEMEKEKALEKIISLDAKLKSTIHDLARLETVSRYSELKGFIKEESGKAQKQQLPFRQMEIMGYDVFIGKSAGSNDELLHFAHKEDVWLHARGVSGSHVIIKRKGKNAVPKEVIEKAASIAAWHSKGRNAELCPVVYTLRKYVRKPKGAAPGAVVVDREEVVMVEAKKSLQG